MRLIVTKCDWGMDYLGDLKQRLKAFAEAGYDGVECFFVAMDPGEFVDECQTRGLEFNAGIVAPTVEAFRLELTRSLELNPSLINCHAGREFITVCPEYGPPPYAPADPDTNEPFSHPWDLSLWAMERFRSRWTERLAI